MQLRPPTPFFENRNNTGSNNVRFPPTSAVIDPLRTPFLRSNVASMVRAARARPQAMEFRPVRPPLRSLWPSAFLAVLFLIVVPGILEAPSLWPVIGLTGVGLLIAGGIWLWFRGRFPGHPTLRVDAAGMTYLRGGHERSLEWSKVAAIQADFTLDRMLFIPTNGSKPIVMHRNMGSPDGGAWAMVVEQYWRPPKDSGRSRGD